MRFGGRELCDIIDGYPAESAWYRLAGEIGVNPAEYTLRELWIMADGRRQASRQACVWQAVATNALDKLDVVAFIRRGDIGKARAAKVTMPGWLRDRVDEEIGRMNREKQQHGSTI